MQEIRYPQKHNLTETSRLNLSRQSIHKVTLNRAGARILG